MIAVLILIPVIGFALFILACYKTDWEVIDEQNRQFYVDGYHIYYCLLYTSDAADEL